MPDVTLVEAVNLALGFELARGRVAAPGLLLHRLVTDRPEIAVHARVDASHGHRLVVADAAQDLL